MIEQRNDSVEEVIPLVQEHLTVGKRTVETGTVRVSTRLEEQTETITADLQRENVVVERVRSTG
jgi:stress response protein YsnF